MFFPNFLFNWLFLVGLIQVHTSMRLCCLCAGRAFFVAATLIKPSQQGTETRLPSCPLSGHAPHAGNTATVRQGACHNSDLSRVQVRGEDHGRAKDGFSVCEDWEREATRSPGVVATFFGGRGTAHPDWDQWTCQITPRGWNNLTAARPA